MMFCTRSSYRKLCRPGWKIKLAGGFHPHGLVLLSLIFYLLTNVLSGLYLILAVTFWFYPGMWPLVHSFAIKCNINTGTDPSNLLASCK